MIKNAFTRMLLILVALQVTGCASYYSHYGSFTAQNSSGETRLFVVSWDTEEYPSWAIQDDNGTAIVLEAQCSERKWQMVDSSMSQEICNQSNKGVVACGSPGLDLNSAGQSVIDNASLCLSVSDKRGAESVASLGKEILVKVDCLPESTTLKIDGELENMDYLKASVVPYTVSTKKVVRHSFGAKAPVLSDKICDKPE